MKNTQRITRNLNKSEKTGILFSCLLTLALTAVLSKTPLLSIAQNLIGSDQNPVSYTDDGTAYPSSYDQTVEYYEKTIDNTYYEPPQDELYPSYQPDPSQEYTEQPYYDASGQTISGEMICTMEYFPVCGTDGRTYSNKCEAHKNQTDIKYNGECGNTNEPPTTDEPPKQPCGNNNYCADGDYCANPNQGWCCRKGQQICSDGKCVDNADMCGGNMGWEYYSDDNMHQSAPDGTDNGNNGEWSDGGGGEYWDNPIERTDPHAEERMKRQIERTEREITRFVKQIKRAEEKGLKINDDITSSIEKIESLFKTAKEKLDPTDTEPFWWAIEDINDIINSELREKIDNLERAYHLERFFKDMTRMINDMDRETEKLKRNEIEAPVVYKKIKKLFKKAEKEYKNGNYEDAQWTLEDLSEISRDFWDEMEKLHVKSFRGNIEERGKNVIEEVKAGLEEAKHIIIKLEEEGKNTSHLHELMKKAFSLLERLREAVKNNDTEDIDKIMEKMEFGIKEAFEREIANITGRKVEDIWADAYSKDDFIQHFEMDDDKAEKIMERIASQMSKKIMAKLMNKGLSSSVMESLVSTGFENEVKKTFENMSFMNTGVTEIANKKVEILDKIKSIDKQIKELENQKKVAINKLNELKEIKDKIANYNFASEAGDEIKSKIETFMNIAEESGASKSAIEKGITELKKEAEQAFKNARKEKFKKGIIPFADTDDNEWYTPYAAEAKENGLIKGTGTSGGTELNPGGMTNLAEAITMLGRMANAEGTGIPSSAVGKRMPEWAQNTAVALEHSGVNLDKIFGAKNAGDTITRAEAARVLKDMLNLPSGEANFSDITSASSDEQTAIGAVNRAEIMTGEGGTSNFNPKGGLNRAALVKVITEAMKLAE